MKKEVELLGGKCVKWRSSQINGVPDRIVLLNGKVYFVEVKRTTGIISKLQIMFGKWLINNNFDFTIIMSVYDVHYFIDRLINENKPT